MRERLRDRLLAHLRGDHPDVGPDTHLIEEEIVDSIGILELVALVESELGVELEQELVRAETFASVSAIVRALEQRGLLPAA